MTHNQDIRGVRFALPKGRIQPGVTRLLAEAGVELRASERGYRPLLSLAGFDVKLLKPQNIVEMLNAGSRDVGFTGADWVAELDADLVELLDTELDPVRLVAAAPASLIEDGRLARRTLTVASEYERLTQSWIRRCELDARFVRSYGATEVFPPEDADCIVDNTSTGSTLRANGLVIVDELMRSSTRLYANRRALDNALKRDAIEGLVTLVRAVLTARQRVMLEVNVSASALEAIVAALPCMREPTVANLAANAGYAVKAAVPRTKLAALIPKLQALGGTDIVVCQPSQIVA
jgi:ATP phosphoribosyltransferase